MPYSREYGRDSSDCANCERHSINLVHVECYSCGRQGCDACLTLQTDAPDSGTGYRDERYVCQACACIGNDPLAGSTVFTDEFGALANGLPTKRLIR